MGYIGKITAGGVTGRIASTLYGTSTTGATAVEKVVTCSDFDVLMEGVTIHVKFSYSNTAVNPTLNVNGTGAKRIYLYGTTAPSNTSATSWPDGSVVSFTYDGNAWQMNGWNNTTYTGGEGIEVAGTEINNTGVRSVSEGTANGTIRVNTGGTSANVSVHGLGSAAYTSSDSYAASSHSHFTGTPANNQVVVADGTAGNVKTSGYTIASSVPANAKFTDTTYPTITQQEISAGSSTENRVVTPALLKGAIETWSTNVEPATSTPIVSGGVGAVGSSLKYAREDHKHPEPNTVNGHTVESDVPANANFSNTVYAPVNETVGVVTYRETISLRDVLHWVNGSEPTSGPPIVVSRIDSFDAGTAPSAEYANNTLIINSGTAPVLNFVRDVSVPNITSTGTMPSLVIDNKSFESLSMSEKSVIVDLISSESGGGGGGGEGSTTNYAFTDSGSGTITITEVG